MYFIYFLHIFHARNKSQPLPKIHYFVLC